MNTEIRKRPAGVAEYPFTYDTVKGFLLLPFETRLDILGELVSKTQLLQVMLLTCIPQKKFLDLLGVSSGAIYYRESDDLYAFAISRGILAIVDIYSYGYSRANSQLAFNDWMLQSSFYNGFPPVHYCSHQIGRLQIMSEIDRLQNQGHELFK